MRITKLTVVQSCLVVIAFVSFGNFSSAAFGDGIGSVQQITITACWALISLTCLTVRSSAAIDRHFAALLAASIIYLCLSSFWSQDPLATLTKGSVLAANCLGAAILCSRVPLHTVLVAVRRGLLALLVVSVLFVFLLPSVGLHHDWQHAGKWRGIMEQKQLLGAASVVLAMLYLLTAEGWRRVLPVGLAVACVIGSQSRNSLVLIVLTALLYAMVLNLRSAQRLAALLPAAIAVLAFGLLAWIIATGATAIDLGDDQVTFTGRTYIWSFALSGWQASPLEGYGLSGFWGDNLAAFRSLYGWALDNYHSGYLAILVEGGLLLYVAMMGLVTLTARAVYGIDRTFLASSYAGGFVAIYPVYFAVLNLTETFWYRSTSGYFLLFVITALAARQYMVPAGRAIRAGVSPSPFAAAT